MRLKVFSTLILLFFTLGAMAQHSIKGTVTDAATHKPLADVRIAIKNEKSTLLMAVSKNNGQFYIDQLGNETYQLVFSLQGYEKIITSATVQGKDLTIQIQLAELTKELKEVEVMDKGNEFGFGRLRSVENMAIYSGKKSELIIPENLTVNMATNNARQLYSRVAGLNIYENDGSGLQLSIGGRGLDPNRTANFNVRQNGYDISADALGYPESYYTPPVEAIDRIQIVRGAASLQYGTQFGGLLNFQMKKPATDKPFEVVSRQTGGSYGFFNSFNSVSGTSGKLGYYAFFQYKRGNGWRPNSNFEAYSGYINLHYNINPNIVIDGQYTHMNYLAKQPGGLTDHMFYQDPMQSNRERNWFDVNWNLFSLTYNHQLTAATKVEVQGFGLIADREALGFRPIRPETPDNNGYRDLIDGRFTNWGVESRFMHCYQLKNNPSVLLLGVRYYNGLNKSKQGIGSNGSDADFNFVNPEDQMLSDYRFPNKNLALFGENVFNISSTFSLTPGFRYEFIRTIADGYYRNIVTDLAGNIIENTRYEEYQNRPRHFWLFGLGVSYKPNEYFELYSNVSQNYRSITFNDIRVVNPSFIIDENIKDESGYSADIGIRGNRDRLFNYDVSAFVLNYNDRIGEILYDDGRFVKRMRTNIGDALILGLESYAEINVISLFKKDETNRHLSVFGNMAFIQSKYTKSKRSGIVGNEVEFVPDINIKVGTSFGYKSFKASLQYSYLSEQFTDATNAMVPDPVTGITGLIPSYYIVDLSASYQYKFLRFEASANNLTNKMYFTRRATGYPGPGIIPSDGRGFFITVQAKF